MKRVRIGILGTGASVEWSILPALSGSDVLAPPDTGAWWSRRPTPAGDIRYQPPAAPEIAALGEDTGEKPTGKVSPRLESLGRTAKASSLYGDARSMLREMPLDALLIAAGDDEGLDPSQIFQLVSASPGLQNGVAPPRWVWIDGPPARTVAGLRVFARSAASGSPALWIAAPLRRAAAHRAARRLLDRDGIGEVTAIQARFPFSLDAARFSAAYAAFDLMLSFVGGGAGTPCETFASRHADGAASVMLKLSGGATITALFGASDVWNSPLPRLEICGTQGRFLVCEAGRRLWHHVPREGARLWEPPGMASHVTAANLVGYSEDLKAFLSVYANNPAPFNAERALDHAARALGALEATLRSLETGQVRPILSRGAHIPPVPEDGLELRLVAEEVPIEVEPPRNLVLELGI